MNTSLTISQAIALFSAMVVLAALPSISLLTVVTRAATFGFIHGAFTGLGIVFGDIIFILIAIWGLAILAASMGGLFVLIKYLGALYLMTMGIRMLRSRAQIAVAGEIATSSLWSSFWAGLLITLGDQKAIVFYLGFLPAFLNLSMLSVADVGGVIAIVILAVGGVKLIYAWLASRASLLIQPRVNHGLNLVAGCIMFVVGLGLLFKP